jgi:hypothetical protein
VTGIGIAGNIRRHYSVWVLYPVVALLLSANVINLGAEIGAMGGALKLLIGGPALLYSVGFGIASAINRGVSSISTVCADTKMVGAGAAGVRRDGLCRPRALAIRAGSNVYPEHLTINKFSVRVDGSIRNYD